MGGTDVDAPCLPDEEDHAVREDRRLLSVSGFAIYKTSIAASGQLEDRIGIFPHARGLVLAIADGAGGLGGGAHAAESVIEGVRAALQPKNSAPALPDWGKVLRALDRGLAKDPLAGQSTGVVVDLREHGLIGASVGDSGAWLVSDRGIDDLTECQRLKPLLGSGEAEVVSFSREFVSGNLLLASDGLLKYASRQAIKAELLNADLETAGGCLLELVRLPSGAFWDDVSFLVCRRPEAGGNTRPESLDVEKKCAGRRASH
jgi:serine/threonine protein phosphatase PrpC